MKNIPAFPQSIMEGSAGGVVGGCDFSGRYEGMTLRDYFANTALIHMMEQEGPISGGEYGDELRARIAKDSYLMADAMLKEREQP